MAPPVPLPADRSLTETLRLVETVVWSLCTLVAAAFLVVALVGAFLVAAQPVGVTSGALLASVVVGTLVFVLAEFVFE